MNLLPLSLECLTSLVKSLPQGSDLFIPLVPILLGLSFLGYEVTKGTK